MMSYLFEHSEKILTVGAVYDRPDFVDCRKVALIERPYSCVPAIFFHSFHATTYLTAGASRNS